MSKRIHSMRRFTAILISGALTSKLLGFGREVLMAHVLGASLVADGFRGALAAVFIPLALLQNESVPAIMIPMHREALKTTEAPRRLGALTIAVAVMAIVLTGAIELLGQFWVNALVGGFSPEGQVLTLQFVRIMAAGMPASAMLNVLAAGEIALGRTRLTNVRASLLNLSVLLGIGLMVLTGDTHALAWSFTLAFNALAAWGVILLWREKLLSFAGLTPGLVWAAALDFLRRLRVLVVLPLAEQGNVWVERLIASRLTTGALASLDYARTLTESALLLISQPVGMAVLSDHSPKNAGAQAEAIARPLLALAVPASAFLLVFADDVVRLVFFRGAFGDEALLLTTHALRGIAFGVWASTLGWVLIRILNGAGRNSLAAIIIVSAYAVNIAVNLLTSHMQTASGPGMLLLGLGESSRSFVLLAAVILALESRRKIAFLILLSLVPASLMLAGGLLIQGAFSDSIQRLLFGGLAFLVCFAFAVGLLMPATCIWGYNRVRIAFRGRGD